jgi:3-hydroxyisobutyrate dehydrogenase-like beta-hydroxyacid dehydrogenase
MIASDSDKVVCVIGLGNMGGALAEALLKAGHTVTVWNRTPAKYAPLRAKGATVAVSAAEAIAAARVAIVCVSDHAAAKTIVLEENVGRAVRDKLLIQLSTISAEQSRETAAWAEQHGASYLEGSIMASPADIIGGSGIIVYAGARPLFDGNLDMLAALGGNPKHIGEEIGAAVTFDRSIFAFGYGATQSFIQGAAIAVANGATVETYAEIAIARMAAYSARFKWLADMIARRRYDENVGASMRVHATAFAEALAICREAGVDETLPEAAMRNFQHAIDAGYGEQEIAALFEVLIGRRR